MNDFTFGNYLCTLRENAGLSQYQLGTLLGVTDKAVSKWENGAAKPRTKLCERLANIFGISVDELLSAGESPRQAAKKLLAERNAALWERAENLLHKRYGSTPPIQVMSRFEMEKSLLQETNAIYHFEFLRQINALAGEQCGKITHFGMIGSSFVAWLMGVTRVNPLPPHEYCPDCRKIMFHPEVEDGWDLPEATCTCGRKLLRDGHNIPVDAFAKEMRNTGEDFEFACAPALENSIVELMSRYYTGTHRVIPVDFGFCHYVLFPLWETAPETEPDGVLRVSTEQYYKMFKPYDRILLITNQHEEAKLQNAANSGILPTDEMLMAPDILHKAYEKRVQNALELPITPCDFNPLFSQLARFDGLKRDTLSLPADAQWAEELGTIPLRDLPVYREDIWEKVHKELLPTCNSSAGLAVSIMEDTRLGRYKKRGMPEEIISALKSIHVPDWYMGFMQNAKYLFPKSHCIEHLIDELICIVQQNKVQSEPQ